MYILRVFSDRYVRLGWVKAGACTLPALWARLWMHLQRRRLVSVVAPPITHPGLVGRKRSAHLLAKIEAVLVGSELTLEAFCAVRS